MEKKQETPVEGLGAVLKRIAARSLAEKTRLTGGGREAPLSRNARIRKRLGIEETDDANGKPQDADSSA